MNFKTIQYQLDISKYSVLKKTYNKLERQLSISENICTDLKP